MKLNISAIIGTITAALAALILAGTTFAGEEEESGVGEKPSFEALDSNIDGVITETEARDTWLASAFQEVDTDGNGLVSRSEYYEAVS